MKFYCNELSLVVCFTRITVNVPRIVINCFWGIALGCGWLQQPCHADAGLCAGGHLWLRHTGICPSLIWKTDIAYRGVVGSSILDSDAPSFILTEQQSSCPLQSWRTRIRHLLSSWDSLLSSLRVIARHEAIHLWPIYVRFVSKKRKTHPFHFQLLTRLQTTANDYSRLQTFIQRLILDKGCIFAT